MTRKIITALTCLSVMLALHLHPTLSKATDEPVVGKTIIAVDVAVVATTGYRATELLGADVYNEKAEKIGVLEDFIVGADDEVSVAIVGVGGFLGIGGRRVAIPTSLIETNELHQIILPNGTKEELMGLPSFNYVK